MGSTGNHIAAVEVPVIGGFLWASVGYQITFLAGAATCILSVVAARAIKEEGRPAATPVTLEDLERQGELSATALAQAEGVVAIAPER